MTKFVRAASLLLVTFIGLALPCQATNLAQENDISYSIKNTLKQGQAIELSDGSRPFLGVFQETSHPVKQGGIIILHGTGQNPNSPGVIRTLRTGLAKSGWDTLTIQMPIPALDSEINEIASRASETGPRITAAISYFTEKSNTNLAIVGFGNGASQAAVYLEQFTDTAVRALGMISLDGTPEPVIKSLETLKIPLLDLYGSRDSSAVVNSAKAKKRAILQKAGNPNFRQISVDGADKLFTGLEQPLLSLVRGWLHKYAAGAEVSF